MDKENTQSVQEMLMRVGSGVKAGSGIHSHIVSKIHYLPANEKRTEIARVYVQRPDGTREEYVNPAYEKIAVGSEEKQRFMDCIDCHNRPAHHFDTYEKLLDNALTQGDISRSIPFIKRELMEAAGDPEKLPSVEEQKAALKRIAAIPDRYRETMPDAYQAREREVRIAAKIASMIYRSTYFPHMRVGPGTYPDWRTHEGCFRCHGVLVSKKDQQPISQDCNLCHTLPGALPGTSARAGEQSLKEARL